MPGAPAGAEVGIYVDAAQELAAGAAVVTTTGRTYIVVRVRRQARGRHLGRQHLRCIVSDIPPPAGVRILRLRWYRRRRRVPG